MDLKLEFDRLLGEKILPDASYYQFSLFADQNGKFTYGFTSNWAGWSDRHPKHEIREPSLVDPISTIELYRDIGEPALIINNYRDLTIHLQLLGGNSIIEKSLADQYLNSILRPTINAFLFDRGYVEISSLRPGALNRAPNPKLRMAIIKRDKGRCKICGASPQTNEHVELHLHHIIPFAKGGITDAKNLVTLCHTCHKGLEPHLDYTLFDNITTSYLENSLIEENYIKRIRRNIDYFIKRIRDNKK
jgi:hypothetical protein